MKKLFYIGLIGLVVFEIANVYFIMPMPGSQRMESIGLAYFLYSWRWWFRIGFGILALVGSTQAVKTRRKWIPAAMVLLAVAIVYLFNFRMTADKMFLQPKTLVFEGAGGNAISGERIIIGVSHGGEAKAYPISFMAYHHQVRDTVGGKPLMITYCNVCRTGRIFEPVVNGKPEQFRLVGMDHFNAMFEDATTRSWWRQANGEAIAGPLRGQLLPEVHAYQMSVDKWFALFPHGLVMQPDPKFMTSYDSLARFEQGKSTGALTRTDSLSWQDKSWVVGVEVGGESKAYDWIELKKNRTIQDVIGESSILLALSADERSFVALEVPAHTQFSIDSTDMLISDSLRFDFTGKSLNPGTPSLKPIKAYQEFWHSWRTFHPETGRSSSKKM